MRFFIALEIPEQSKQQLKQVQQQIKQLLPQVRLTDNDKLHLTIAFVGEQPESLREELIDALKHAAAGIQSFNITPAYLDGFPNIHHPHTIWVGVKGDVDRLLILRERIKDGLLYLNLETDERRFIPHIAVAKINNHQLTAVEEKAFEQIMSKDFNPIHVSEVKLFESVPEGGLHRHNTLARIPLV